MDNVMVAFASRAAKARNFRASRGGSARMTLFALVRSQRIRPLAAPTVSDIRCFVRIIRRHPKGTDVTPAPVARVAWLTQPPTELSFPSVLQAEARNFSH